MPGVAFERGERVALYTVERDDVEFLQRGRNHPAVRGPLGLAEPTNAEQVEETVENWVEGDDSVSLLVCRTGDEDRGDGEDRDAEGRGGEDRDVEGRGDEPTPMGVTNLVDLDRTRPRIAYWLLARYQGEGYATEATTLLLDYFFDTYEAPGVEARVFSHNDDSQSLVERLGFEREGRLRKNRFVEGAYRDEYVYGLLRDEWVGGE